MLASVARMPTLSEILSDLDKKSADYLSKEHRFRFKHGDVLLVPNMHWRIEHHFKEIEGNDKLLLNPSMKGTWIDQAIQIMELKLDRQGVKISSESMGLTKKAGHDFVFNKPFLIYMKKRGAKHPFFVMWVDNAELLIKN